MAIIIDTIKTRMMKYCVGYVINICSGFGTNFYMSINTYKHRYLAISSCNVWQNLSQYGTGLVQIVTRTPQHFAFYGGSTVKALSKTCIKQIFNQNRTPYNIPPTVINNGLVNLCFAQHVSGTIMPIIRSLRLYRCSQHVAHNLGFLNSDA